jgi:hypothetical protein
MKAWHTPILLFLCAPSGANALFMHGGFRILECAVIFERFEPEDGDVLPFDVENAAHQMRDYVARFHGTKFVASVTDKLEAEWEQDPLDWATANRLRELLPFCHEFGKRLGVL